MIENEAGSYPMKKTDLKAMVLILLLDLMAPPPSRAQNAAAESRWASGNIKIDGIAKEWDGIPLLTWDKAEIQYAFQNDADTLYILFIFKNPKYRSSVGEEGIFVYLDETRKTRNNYGISLRKRRITAGELLNNTGSSDRIPTKYSFLSELRLAAKFKND
jgi:hypothetical protein